MARKRKTFLHLCWAGHALQVLKGSISFSNKRIMIPSGEKAAGEYEGVTEEKRGQRTKRLREGKGPNKTIENEIHSIYNRI